MVLAAPLANLQCIDNRSYLGKCSLKVLHDLASDDLGRREVGCINDGVIFQPQNVEVLLVSSN